MGLGEIGSRRDGSMGRRAGWCRQSREEMKEALERKKNEKEKKKKGEAGERGRKKMRKYFFNERRERSLIYIYIYILASYSSAQLFMAVHYSKKLKNFSYDTTTASCFLGIGGAK